MWWVGGGKIENKAKLRPSKAGARAELCKNDIFQSVCLRMEIGPLLELVLANL
jgi:hypothetical protein